MDFRLKIIAVIFMLLYLFRYNSDGKTNLTYATYKAQAVESVSTYTTVVQED